MKRVIKKLILDFSDGIKSLIINTVEKRKANGINNGTKNLVIKNL